MEQAIRIGKHLIAPAMAAYLFYLSTWPVPLAEKYAITGSLILIGMGFGYAVAWVARYMDDMKW